MTMPCTWPYWSVAVTDPVDDSASLYRLHAPDEDAADEDARRSFAGVKATRQQRERLQVTVEPIGEGS